MRSSYRSTKAAAALLLAVIAAEAPAAKPLRRLPPVDQCASDPSFVAFRTKLKQAIAAKHVGRFMALMSDDVTVDFGGGVGRKAFIEAWGLDKPAASRLWNEAATVLALGCVRIERSYAAPSFAWQLGDGDEAFGLVVGKPGALLKAKPSDASATILKLDWHVLKSGDLVDGGPWAAVTLSDGRKGYARESGLRSPLDYHFAFEKRRGKWMVTAFVAGD